MQSITISARRISRCRRTVDETAGEAPQVVIVGRCQQWAALRELIEKPLVMVAGVGGEEVPLRTREISQDRWSSGLSFSVPGQKWFTVSRASPAAAAKAFSAGSAAGAPRCVLDWLSEAAVHSC